MRYRVVPLVLVVFLTVGCTRDGQQPTGAGDAQSHAGSDSLKEVWSCPMHPQVRRDAPGSCPICGMDLVKSEVMEDSGGGPKGESALDMPDGHTGFHLSEKRQQMIGVKSGPVVRKPLFKAIEAAGRVAFDPELYTAQNEYLEAVRQAERVRNSPIADVRHSAQRMVESAKLRLKILGLSEEQIKRIARTGPGRTDSSGANLLIPKPGEEIMVYAEVFEMDLRDVKQGQKARITGDSLDQPLEGEVVSVDPVINPATRTAKVRIKAPGGISTLRPESYVEVEILSPLGEQTVVPFGAVLDTGKQSWVFLTDGKGYFEPRVVTIKHHAGDEIAIGKGLLPGERIVTSANFLIDSESRLRAVALEPEPEARAPECPPGQVWHAQMGHCMDKVGE